MIPDFEYFLRLEPKSVHSHTLEGVFYFDLPLGILIAFLFHNLVKNSLFENLPLFLKNRLYGFKDFHWNSYFKKHYLVVVFSLILGVFSHVFWDTFTHNTGFFVEKLSVLQSTFTVMNFEIPVFKFLQHSSTLLGAFFIFLWIKSLPKKEVKSSANFYHYWKYVISISFLLVLIKNFFTYPNFHIGNFIVSSISMFFLSILISSFIFQENFKIKFN